MGGGKLGREVQDISHNVERAGDQSREIGCVSEGETRDEALANIREAIGLYLDPVDDDFAAGGTAELVEIAL